MKPLIVLPINTNDDNRRAFSAAMHLSRSSNANLLVLSAIDEKDAESQKDKAYLHLLSLDGYYKTQQKLWQKVRQPKTILRVMTGSLANQLQALVKRKELCGIAIEKFSKIEALLKLKQEELEEYAIDLHFV